MNEPARERWHAIGELARLVPTPHNTQPYRIRPTSATEAELVLVCERLLPDEDHGNLYVLSAFGVFASAIEHAGRAVGCTIHARACDQLDGTSLGRSGQIVVGSAVIVAETVREQPELLASRRTSRLPYRPDPVDPHALAALERIAADAGHRMTVVSDPRLVREVLWMNAEAIIDNLQITREREEIRRWYRYGATPQHGDGLWEAPMNQPAWQIKAAFCVPWLIACDPMRTLAVARYVETQRGTQHVALLRGPFARWSELVAAGRMLLELWLAMAAANVYMHPFGSMLTNPTYASWVERTFEAADTWLIVRLGYSEPPPAAPRLASIVIA
jgi:hypothetical protein